MARKNLIEGQPRNISTKSFENRPNTFGGEDFLSFHYSHIRQNSPAPWRPCFWTNQLGLKESDRGSLKEHFYKIIWNRPDTFGGEDFLSLHYFFLSVTMETRILHGSKTFEGEDIERMLPMNFIRKKLTHAQWTIHHDISSSGFQPVELKNRNLWPNPWNRQHSMPLTFANIVSKIEITYNKQYLLSHQCFLICLK